LPVTRGNLYGRRSEHIGREGDMARRRKIEVFTAGCRVCAEVAEPVKFPAGVNHDIEIRDMRGGN